LGLRPFGDPEDTKPAAARGPVVASHGRPARPPSFDVAAHRRRRPDPAADITAKPRVVKAARVVLRRVALRVRVPVG
jgi:hypothetical protein